MAKDSDHLAGSFDTENTGGFLTGLLAEEDNFDRRMLWRLGSWGAAAVGAVVVAVMTNGSPIGLRREQVAGTDLTRQSQQIQLVAKESQNEARRLASAIETLNGDRDRLYSRVTGLEQGLDSVTGAIARQGSTAPAPPTPVPAAEPQAAQSPAPAVAPVAMTQAGASTPEKPAVTAPSEPGPAAISSVAKDPPKDSAKDLAKTEIPKPENKKAEAAKSDSAKSAAGSVHHSARWKPAAASSRFRLIESTSGRLDYLETIRQWRQRFVEPSFKKTLVKLTLVPRWLTSSDFRLAFTSGARSS
jgi:hypothetical protein